MSQYHLRTDTFDRAGGGPAQMLEWAKKAAERDTLLWSIDSWLQDTKDPSMRAVLGIIKSRAQKDVLEALDGVVSVFEQMVSSLKDSTHALKYLEEIKSEQAGEILESSKNMGAPVLSEPGDSSSFFDEARKDRSEPNKTPSSGLLEVREVSSSIPSSQGT